MATAQNIADSARAVLQTDDTDLTDAMILLFANDATRRILGRHNHWPHLYTDGTLAVVAGTQSYVLASASFTPQTYTSIESVFDDNGFGLSLQEIDWQEASRYWIGTTLTMSSDRPGYFTVYNGSLKLWPRPSGTRTFRVGGYRDATDMTLMSNSPDLPLLYHNAVAFGTISLAQAQQEDYEGAQYWASMANGATAAADRTFFNKTVHRPAQLYGRGGPRLMTYPDWVRTMIP